LNYKNPYDIDSPERTILHRHIISNKPFLKRLYQEWYKEFTTIIPGLPEGKYVELGSGGGFLKELDHRIICSDFLELPSNDLTFSALEMPFENDEVSGIFMLDTFHHLPDSEKFLKEACRVLKKGGQMIMIEPANSLWSRFIYKNFHHEAFNPKGNWTIPGSGPLSGANGALPWIVFERDFLKFKDLFPCLEITRIKYHTPLRYLFSGGVSHNQVVPDFFFSPLKLFDKILSSLSKQISMFVTIIIKKIN
jgi:SAM-dependent methyltransferase